MKIIKHSIAYTLMALGLVCLALIIAGAIAVEFFPNSLAAQRIQDAVVWDQTDAPLQSDQSAVFRKELQAQVQEKLGTPIEGYEPWMFLQVFPGLTETDFERVQASIGHYAIENGELIYVQDPAKLIHSAAKSITDEGMETLLHNVSVRLKVDLAEGGTLTKIMSALLRTQS